MSAQVLAFTNPMLPALSNTADQELLHSDPAKLTIARQRVRLVQAVQAVMQDIGWSLHKAAKHIHTLATSPKHPLHQVACELGKGNKPVGAAQIKRWYKLYIDLGIQGLIDGRQGRVKKDEGWELRAMAIYQRPSKPSYSGVTDELLSEGFDVTYHKVRRYIRNLPTDMAEFSNSRQGAHYNRLNNKEYKIRNTEDLPVGFIYQGDGHTCDVYVGHPNTGDIFRPELTIWMDVRSRYITGWWLGEAENSTDTIFALSHAMCGHNHVPAMLHVDHGAGYRSHMMNNASTGFYKRFAIEVMFAIPGNAKGKGQVERWFGTMERSFGKRFDTYCGKDMAGDALRKIVKGVKAGTYTLPTLQEYKERLTAWIEEYHNKPHRGLDGKTPAEVWAGLEQVTLDMPMDAVVLPVAERIVRRTGISLDKRLYRNDDLGHYEGKKVHVQYSVHTDQMVRILDTDGRWICDAKLVERSAYISESRLQDNKVKRLKGQQKRLQIKADENERRATLDLEVEPDLSQLDSLKIIENKPDNEGATLLSDLDDEPIITDSPFIDLTDISWAKRDDDFL